jgi:hypothetical protein
MEVKRGAEHSSVADPFTEPGAKKMRGMDFGSQRCNRAAFEITPV